MSDTDKDRGTDTIREEVLEQTERKSRWKQRKGKPGGDTMKGLMRKEARQDGGGSPVHSHSWAALRFWCSKLLFHFSALRFGEFPDNQHDSDVHIIQQTIQVGPMN